MPSPPKNIDEYLNRLSPAQRAVLQKLREQILAIVPSAQECISYSMPAFRVQGGVVAGFLATRQGCSFFPFSGRTLDTLAADLTGYSQTKGSRAWVTDNAGTQAREGASSRAHGAPAKEAGNQQGRRQEEDRRQEEASVNASPMNVAPAWRVQ
jgi:uncharacterized protein YdhG (YjbR/CyaY superfamily)